MDLSRAEVRQWIIEMLDHYITNLNLGWIRYDLNVGPGGAWQNVDAARPPNRQGIQEIRYIEGLYEVLDTLTQRRPDLWFEYTAGGGNRFDLETISRTPASWISDYIGVTGDGDTKRPHLSGANLFLPANFLDTALTRYNSMYDYYCQFGGTMLIGPDFRQATQEQLNLLIQGIQLYKNVRHLIVKDFYPLFDHTLELTKWDGWQFHDPVNDEGFFLVFRLSQSPDSQKVIRLRGLNPAKEYILTPDSPCNLPASADGRQLMDSLSVQIDSPRSALLVRYH